MQVLIEGLALAAFGVQRDLAPEGSLAKQLLAYVMQDEARHVAFGRISLKDYYSALTEAERDDREEFVVDACYLMRDRFRGEEVFETLGLNVEACASGSTLAADDPVPLAPVQPHRADRQGHRPVGAKVQKAFSTWVSSRWPAFDIEALMKADEDQAESLDNHTPRWPAGPSRWTRRSPRAPADDVGYREAPTPTIGPDASLG